jgi:NADH-quinone oxidoreductase subunit M
VPIAAIVLWMGVYPETFLAPMRKDIAALDARLARAKPEGDARLKAGKASPAGEHAAEHNATVAAHEGAH